MANNKEQMRARRFPPILTDQLSVMTTRGLLRLFGLMRQTPKVPVNQYNDQVEHFRDRVAAIQSETGPISSSSPEWQAFRTDLRRLALAKDPREFLTWPPIMRTMFVRLRRFTVAELVRLRRSPEWNSRWKPALRENAIGSPLPLLFYPRSSATVVHHVFHVSVLEQALNQRVESFRTVLEFGGGYGSLVRIFGRLGFHGDYYVVDFPEMIALQQFFLSAIASEEQLPRFHPLIAGELPDARPTHPSLFVALWSLSETPTEARDEWFSIMHRFSAVFIAYQDHYGSSINNEAWVRMLLADKTYTWVHRQIPSLPGSRYLIGRRRTP